MYTAMSVLIDLFVCGNSSAKTMAEKRKQMSKCFCSRMKHFNQRKSFENERQSGRPRKTVDKLPCPN
jgi:hypothetical protein